MSISILHISDLHRDPQQEVTNEALRNSLERDRDRYITENPRIASPQLVIVSGDIVHGVSPTVENPDRELRRQYDQAESFLGSIADSFVDGDRGRVVIIPGNHDISFPHALRGMKEIPLNLTTPEGQAVAIANSRRLFSPASSVRWSWNKFCFYEIEDRTLYEARLEAFSAFYERFYNSTRKYSLKPEEQFDIFDFPAYNITIAGLSSCYENDPLNKQGAIHPDSIAAAIRRLCEPQYSERLLMAVWHHNTNGGPQQSDYIDSDILQVLIDGGISIGLHGHQHRTQVVEERYLFGGARKMSVISAGTLCAGPQALPTGHVRAYNLLELDVQALQAKLHQRKMMNENQGLPIWGAGHFVSTQKSFIAFPVQSPLERNHRSSVLQAIGSAETLLRNGKWPEAVKLLEPLANKNALAKKLLWECYVALGDSKAIVEGYFPPQSVAEVIHVADALWEEGDTARLKQLLECDFVKSSVDPSITSISKKFSSRL